MDWNQIYTEAVPIIKQICTVFIIPLLVAFIKSERMALDNSTQANGIAHWYKLAKEALAVVPPETIKAVEDKADSLLPGASQVIEETIKENTDEKTNASAASTSVLE